MCYTGGPYCYKGVLKTLRNSQRRLSKNDTPENRKKLYSALSKVDSTVEGQELLSKKIEKETDPLTKKFLVERLESAQKRRSQQEAKLNALKAEKSKEIRGLEEGHIAFKKADRQQFLPEDSKNLTETEKHDIAVWSKNHDKDGKYVYKGEKYVPDMVTHEGTTYYRIGSQDGNGKEYSMSEPYSFRIQVDHELDEESAERLSNIAKYAYASTGGEKSMHEETIQDSPNSVIVHLDTTKNRAYRRLDRFTDNLSQYFKEGTPIRKKMGGRAVEGIQGANKIEIYADTVESH